MIESLIILVTIIISYILGTKRGKEIKENEYKKQQITNIKKATIIDNSTNDVINSMYDKYE